MSRILVTGALGQIGTELTRALRHEYGSENVLATDIRLPTGGADGPFEVLDVLDANRLGELVNHHATTHIVHLAAILSATGEQRPDQAWHLNMGGLLSVLEVARSHGCATFVPSSIAAFGPSTPRDGTPQVTVQRPSTMYGITKVAGELLCDYYFERFNVDTRGLRFPGLISHSAPPGGGTTDYAVEIFEAALTAGEYACPLTADTRMDMMFMPDALRAVISLMRAPTQDLVHRNAYNITAMSFTPGELADEIRKHIPHFQLHHRPDPVRQRIADSWPDRLDDSAARREWGWSPEHDLASLVERMLEGTERRLRREAT